jgi:hypothetical protein
MGEAVLAEEERALEVAAEVAGGGWKGVGKKGDWTSASVTMMAGDSGAGGVEGAELDVG